MSINDTKLHCLEVSLNASQVRGIKDIDEVVGKNVTYLILISRNSASWIQEMGDSICSLPLACMHRKKLNVFVSFFEPIFFSTLFPF